MSQIKEPVSMDDSPDIDWRMCVLCQTTCADSLICPYDSKKPSTGAGYSSLARNIERFHQIGSLPLQPLKLTRKYGSKAGEIEALLRRHSAKYHKKCKDLFNNTKLERAEKRKNQEVNEDTNRKSTRRSVSTEKKKCFFCDKDTGTLHRVSTKDNIDPKVKKCANTLKDNMLLAKLASGDMFAVDAEYHTSCLANLYTDARRMEAKEEVTVSDGHLHGVALAELLSYMEEARYENNSTMIFKLSDLVFIVFKQAEAAGS